MKSQEETVAKGKRPRIRHYQREEVVENQTTIVEDARRQRESVMHSPVDEPTSSVKDIGK
jgi:hypothetical protein